MGAPLIINVEKILEVRTHPNADRLDIATVKGWNCVVGRDSLRPGDLVVYIPPDDSILPQILMDIVFANVKIKPPETGRIRTIKIRGAISQGMIITQKQLDGFYKINWKEGTDVKDILGITKFQPKTKAPFTVKNGQQASKKQINPNFRKYTNINHFKNYPNAFDPDELVVASEKIHGTNFRAGYVPIHAENSIKKFFKKIWSRINKKNFKHSGYEFVFGSHNVQLQEKNKENRRMLKSMKRHFKKNVYAQMVDKYDLRNRLNPGEVLYAEIYGANIQKGYTYGLDNDVDMVVIDIMQDGKWLSYGDVQVRVNEKGLRHAPILVYKDPFGKIDWNALVSGPSILCNKQKVREGLVIKSVNETNDYMGRKVFKFINPDYLLKKNNSDWH